MAILISDPDVTWAEKVRKHFAQLNHLADVAENGKDCQLKIYKKKYDCIILDIDTSNHSGAEVLKFIRLNYPSIRVILTISSPKRFDEIKISKDDFSRMGVSSLLVKPYSLDRIVEVIQEQNFHSSWKNIIENDELKDEEEVTLPDHEFTRLDLKSMSLENAAIFDCYVRVAKNKYIKLFSKGDRFEKDRINKHFGNSEQWYMYFRTKDRSIYINFMNDQINNIVSNKDIPTLKKVALAKNLAEKYIEEVHTKGLHTQLVEEGRRACENMFDLVQSSKDLSSLMRDYQEHQDDQLTHSFLTSFFSVMMAKNLKWKSNRTIEAIALGGLLHDIGKLKLDKKFRDKEASLLTDWELVQYQKHPRYGVELLERCPDISEAVAQIVYQHHELMDGEGFPNKLTGSKIYPLAKVVCLADAFSHEMLIKKLTPIDTLKEMISNRKRVFQFDPIVMKALITCFIQTEEK